MQFCPYFTFLRRHPPWELLYPAISAWNKLWKLQSLDICSSFLSLFSHPTCTFTRPRWTRPAEALSTMAMASVGGWRWRMASKTMSSVAGRLRSENKKVVPRFAALCFNPGAGPLWIAFKTFKRLSFALGRRRCGSEGGRIWPSSCCQHLALISRPNGVRFLWGLQHLIASCELKWMIYGKSTSLSLPTISLQ